MGSSILTITSLDTHSHYLPADWQTFVSHKLPESDRVRHSRSLSSYDALPLGNASRAGLQALSDHFRRIWYVPFAVVWPDLRTF